jgi:hypothetical protein
LPADAGPDPRDPEEILRRLPQSEREAFLSEYRTALDAAHEVWRFRQLQDVLTRWGLVALTTTHPDYADSLAEARSAATPGMTLDEIAARRTSR